MGILGLSKSSAAVPVSAPAQQDTEKRDHHQQSNPVTSDKYDSDATSDTLSLEARNEREVELHPDEITSDADLGVKKAEAVALVWPKKATYITYAWYEPTITSLPIDTSLTLP
jgi:hypothetical protein